MTPKRVLLALLAIAFLMPTTLVSVFLTGLFATVALSSGFGGGGPARFAPQLLAATIAVGWLGIISLWRLYLHFRASAELPKSWRWDATGLLLGTLASATLVIGLGVNEISLLVFFGWPVIAAIILAGLLLKARVAA